MYARTPTFDRCGDNRQGGGRQRAAEASRLGYRTILDAEVGTITTAESLAFAALVTDAVDVPTF